MHSRGVLVAWVVWDMLMLLFGLGRLVVAEAWLRVRGKKVAPEEDAY